MNLFLMEAAVDLAELAQFYKPFTDKLENWWTVILDNSANILLALVLFFAFVGISKLLRPLFMRTFGRSFQSNTAALIMTALCRTIIVIVGFMFALSALGLDKALFSLLAGAGVLGIAFGFAFQDLAQNLIAGFILAIRKPFKIGHLVELDGKTGYARNVNLRTIMIETREGQTVTIPNKNVLQNKIINYCGTGLMRIDFKVGVQYTADLKHVEEIITEAIQGLNFIAPEKRIDAFALEFGDSSINISVRFWIPFPGPVGFREAQHFGVLAVKEAFDREKITIPFPIRTLEFDNPNPLKISS